MRNSKRRQYGLRTSQFEFIEELEGRQYFASLSLGAFTYSLPTTSGPGTATVTASVTNNDSGGYSGSLRLQLELSTQPYNSGGVYYTAADSYPLAAVTGGYQSQLTASSSLDIASIPNGTYYVLVVVSEFTGNNNYTIRDGATANNTYTVTSAAARAATDSK